MPFLFSSEGLGIKFVPANNYEINRISGFLCNLIELVNLIRYPATFSVCQVLLKSHQEARARGMTFVLKVKVMELILKSMLSKILVHAKDPWIIRSKDFWIQDFFSPIGCLFYQCPVSFNSSALRPLLETSKKMPKN